MSPEKTPGMSKEDAPDTALMGSKVFFPMLALGALLLYSCGEMLNPFMCAAMANGSGAFFQQMTAVDMVASMSNANTGTRFEAKKIRSFTSPLKLNSKNNNLRSSQSGNSFPKMFKDCDKWSVVTTINPVTEGVTSVANLKDWCMVVIGDTKTSDKYLEEGKLGDRDNVIYLSVDKQKELASNFVERIPYRSFARKNIGFLFAIKHGAKIIYDYDDDNVVQPNLVPFGNDSLTGSITVRKTKEESHSNLSFNPLLYMKPSTDSLWPRGYPLDELTTQGPLEDTTKVKIDMSNVGVVQAVCDADPDFDAIFRLTRKLPVFFGTKEDRPERLLVPSNKYASYNAQATVHMYKAFWGMLLPWTVTGRVTDIWRSYFTQRILQELNLVLVYDPPLVLHDRSPHDYLKDLQAENDLYIKTPGLLKYLNEWKYTGEETAYDLPARLEQMAIDLYEHDFMEIDDVYGMQEWLLALLDIGYTFPTPESTTAIKL